MLKRLTIIKLLSLLIVVSLVLVGCGGGEPENGENGEQTAEPVEWIVNSVWPPNNHNTVGLNEFADKVYYATDGMIKMNVQAGGALGYDGPELLRVVRDGLVPVSDMLASGVAGDEAIYEVVTLPFLVQDFDEARLLNDIARPYFDEIAESKWNQKILYVSPWPAAGIWSQKEIHTLDDMEGLRTRTYDRNGALVMEAVNASPYPLPFSEVYSSLATGVIDSVLTSTPTAVDASFWEVIDYYVPMNVTTAVNLVTVNLNEFNSLDVETQKALVETGNEMHEEMWEMVAELDKEMEAISNENGIVTLEPSEEFLSDLAEITEEIREEWFEDAPAEAREIVDKFLEEVGR